MHIYIYIYTHICIHTYTYAYTYTYTYTYDYCITYIYIYIYSRLGAPNLLGPAPGQVLTFKNLKLTWDSALNVGYPPANPLERTTGAPSPRSDSENIAEVSKMSIRNERGAN